jgi:peptidoglycan/LPS O-acetylase OafA/YrhL
VSFAVAPRPFGRLRGLDGLRALAVAAVVVYHLGLGWLPGGFLGVEIFVVISGYLIPALLLDEWRERGSISLPSFWGRRARRLLPALFLLLLATLAVATVGFPGEVARLRSDAAAATVYVTNWYLIVGQQPYFETVGRTSPLIHLWSLAIEEQFYLLWPIVLGAVLIVLGRIGAFGVAALGAAASVVATFRLYGPGADPSRGSSGTDTRAAGLLAGALLAIVFVPRPSPYGNRSSALRRLLADVVGIAALGAVCAAFALFDETDPLLFQGGMVGLDVATVALIAAVVAPAGRLVPGVLETPPLRWLGTRSYSVYLWHWPIFGFTRPGLDVPLEGAANVALRLGLTVVLAELSYRVVEEPIRHGALGRLWTGWRRDHRGTPRLSLGWLVDVRVAGAFASLAVVSVLLTDVAAATPPPPPAEVPVAVIEGEVTPPPDDVDASTAPDPSSPAATPTVSAAPSPSVVVPPLALVPVERPVVGLGESVLIATAPSIARVVGPIQLDAAIGRQVADDVDALRRRAAKGKLGNTLILNIGNNGPIFKRDADAAMELLRDVPTVVWINVAVPREWQDRNNRLIASYAERYPNIRLVDWYAASKGHPELFAEDEVHPNREGARLLASLVADALRTTAGQ